MSYMDEPAEPARPDPLSGRELEVAISMLEEVTAPLDQGILVLDQETEILFGNRRAFALLRRGIGLDGKADVLSGETDEDSTILRRALNRCLQQNEPQSVVLSPRRRERVFVVVSRLPEQTARLFSPGTVLLVQLSAPAVQRGPSALQLMHLFNLSPAEARVARALAHGHTPEGYANECDLRPSTVRSQIRAVLAKTGSSRISDLVSLLSRIPSSRIPAQNGRGHPLPSPLTAAAASLRGRSSRGMPRRSPHQDDV